LPGTGGAALIDAADFTTSEWRRAAVLHDFACAPTCAQQVPFARPVAPPEVRLAFDAEALYVAWRLTEPRAKDLRGQGAPDPLGRPDAHYDHVEILADAEHNHGELLAVDVDCQGKVQCRRGTRLPAETSADAIIREKETPAPHLLATARLEESGWSGACALPWSLLGGEAPAVGRVRVLGFEFRAIRAAHPACLTAWAGRDFDKAATAGEFGDLYLGEPKIRVTQLDLGRVVFGENALRLVVKPLAGVACPAGLRVETETVLPSEPQPSFHRGGAEFQTTADGAAATAVFQLSPRARWAVESMQPMRLNVAVRDGAGATHFQTRFVFSIDYGIIPTEDWGLPGREPPARPDPDDPNFFDKLRQYLIARIPVFERVAADGRLLLRGPGGSPCFQLFRPNETQRLADWLCSVFATDEDRLLGASLLFHQRTVTFHSGAYSGASALAPLAYLRLGGGLCGSRASALAAFLTLVRRTADRRPFETHTLGLCGHVVTAVDVWPGYGAGGDYEKRRDPDDWAWQHVVLDPDVGCLFISSDNRRLATLGDLRADRDVSLRANINHLRHQRDFYFHTDHQRLSRPIMTNEFPLGVSAW
jgi:hypothetical protein